MFGMDPFMRIRNEVRNALMMMFLIEINKVVLWGVSINLKLPKREPEKRKNLLTILIYVRGEMRGK
jgi:hypothetical protein